MNNKSTNFHPSELEKFSALANRWWNPDLEFRPLHQINPLRLEWINKITNLAGRSVLDVGCGGGILSEAMALKGATVKGIDLAEKPLKVATLHAQNSHANVSYELISAEDLAETQAATFDVVTCMEMLEHVPDPALVIEACSKLAKHNGWVIFSTLNRNPLSWLIAIFGGEYVLRLLPKGTHEYSSFIKPKELKTWAKDAGLELVDLRGLGYNPFTKRFKLHRFLGIGYLLAFRRV
jgi:2-polyprenyl-6-hydroxyphenyl methylase / 3-demethylubiquinone-9 3-methyltransferase